MTEEEKEAKRKEGTLNADFELEELNDNILFLEEQKELPGKSDRFYMECQAQIIGLLCLQRDILRNCLGAVLNALNEAESFQLEDIKTMWDNLYPEEDDAASI
jgi:hypothetical protein